MASSQAIFLVPLALQPSPPTSISFLPAMRFPTPISGSRKLGRRIGCCRAMMDQAVQGAPAIYAKEMERLSAKESLLLAFKDAGGFEALVNGKVTDMHRIDVNERITGLERLNPTPRPTTSPYLEGRWNFEWFGAGSPGLFAARFLFLRSPSGLADLTKMDVYIKDLYVKASANIKLLSSIESKFILTARLSIEGPLRMKEEYVEGILESPSVIEENIPEQLKGAYDQALNTVQQLPSPIKDAISSELKVPLSGVFERMFMISYLDEEILIIRDIYGVPEVLTRIDVPLTPMPDSATEYES